MPRELIYAAAALAAYLLGAVPAGYLVVRLRTGRDIRTLGSGNIGATNVARTLGAAWFLPVFAFDFLKGFAPVFWAAPWIARRWPCGRCADLETTLAVVLGLAALAGHLWPVYLDFRGGKGVATLGGVLFALNAKAALLAMAVWGVVFAPFRYVSLASVVAAIALPLLNHLTAESIRARWATPGLVTAFLALAAALVVWRHRANLQRLRAGTEPKFGRRAPA
jgi:glycerol-3-phosphate acyltransferase PlsY